MSQSLYQNRYHITYSFDENNNAVIDCIVERMDESGAILNPPLTWSGADIDAIVSQMNQCCSPYFRMFKANEIPEDLESFNVVGFYSASDRCLPCDVDVEISCKGELAGTLTIPSSIGEFCPDKFDCLLDGISVTSEDPECLENLYIYVQRTQ